MSNIAVNDAGDVVVFDGAGWRPAPMAQDARGNRVFFDGQAWQPVETRSPEPVFGAARAAGGAVVNAAQQVANVPGSWWSRRARDLIEGPASALSAAVDAMNPGIAAAREIAPTDARRRFMPSVSDLATRGADALGLARPATPGERMTSAVVQGAAGAIPTLGAGLAARAPAAIGGVTGALSQLVGGGVGGAAAEGAAQEGYGPVTQTLAGLAGGLAGAGATQVAGAGLRGAGAVVQPFTAGGRERIVTDAMLQSATDPQNLAARIQAGVDAPDARLPDSPVTTALAARDPRLLAMEASVRDGAAGLEAAAPLRQAQFDRAVAQNAAVDGMADGATPGERGAAVRGQRAQPGQPGAGLRGQEQARRAQVSRLYEGIDPDGSARLPMAPVQAVVSRELAGRWGEGAGAMPPTLRGLVDDLAAAGDTRDWAFMQRVRSRAAAIAGDPAADPRAQATAGEIRSAIDAAAQTAAQAPAQPGGAPGFTPEQATRWQQATAARRQLGQDFEVGATGANATGRILQTAEYGAPRMVDEQVARTALANVSALRQTLRASGGDPQVRQGLQGQFIDDLARAMRTTADVTDGAGRATRVTTPAGFRRFWEQNEAVARELFSGPELRRLELLSRDFAEASIGANTGRTRNSQTVQNLSVAALIARSSNGLLDPTNPTVATFLRPIAWAYRMPEQATRELFGQAMADPRFAAMLLARASSNSVRRAAAYVEQNMGQRAQEIAITGGARQAIRTGAEEERRQSQ